MQKYIIEVLERTSFDISSGDLSISAEMNTDEFALEEHNKIQNNPIDSVQKLTCK